MENFNIPEDFRGFIGHNEKFSDHTTFKTGGLIPLYAAPADEESLISLLKAFSQAQIPSFILGGGSNLVPADEGINFAVISTEALCGIDVYGSEESLSLTCGSGTPIKKVTDFCIENGLSGMETFAGLPGTAGGAAYMNARCYGASISDVLVSARYVSGGAEGYEIREYVMDQKDWDYKKSPFQNGSGVIVSVSFRVGRGDSSSIAEKSASYVKDREEKGHFRYPSAGSVFKNDRNIGKPSGQIVQEAGLRGLQVGGAQVAPWHGNFIINTGNAVSSDIRKLSEMVVSEVKKQTGFELENEILFVDEGLVR